QGPRVIFHDLAQHLGFPFRPVEIGGTRADFDFCNLLGTAGSFTDQSEQLVINLVNLVAQILKRKSRHRYYSPAASLPSSVSSIRARPTSFSSPRTRMSLTPWVIRPRMETSATLVRTNVPWSEISMISSESDTCKAPTSCPL